MNTAFQPCPNHAEWKTLYRAAILERNKSVILRRITEAENAVLARCRELFYGNGTPEEEEALEDALYALRALRALRAALQHTEASEAAWARLGA